MQKGKMKKARGERKEITISGLDVVHSTDSSVTLSIPVIKFPPFHGPMFTEEFHDYCRDHRVSEEILDDMHKSFYSKLFAKEVSRFLMEHIEELADIEDLDSVLEDVER